MIDDPTCPNCGTPMIWHFWDGHDMDGRLIGGTREVCPICDVRPCRPTAWGQSFRKRRIDARVHMFDIAQHTGLSSVRVSDIETGYGEPVTEAERRAVESALAQLEAV